MKWLLLLLVVSASAWAEPEDSTWKKSFLLSRAGDAWAKGRFAEAEKLFGSVLGLDANDEVALLHISVLAKRRGQLDKAIASLTRGATAHPESYALQFELGAALMSAKRPKDAVAPLQAAAALDPKSLDARVNLGDALSLTSAREAAYPVYESAVKLDASSGWAQRQLGACAFELNRPADAVTHLSLAKKALPPDWNIELVLGHAQAQLGNDAAALEAYSRVITLAPQNEVGPLFAGTVLEKLGRVEEARRRYEQAVALKPSSASARIHLGNVFRAQKQNQLARVQFEAAIKAEPKNAWGLMQLGFLELEAKQAARAQTLLARAVALSPNDPELGVGLGDAYQALQKPNEAGRAYEAALARHPTHLAALVKSGDVLRQKGELEAALKRYSDAARLHPKSAWALISLGDALRTAGRLDEAKLRYQAAIESEPESTWAQRQLGFALFELGDDAQALQRLAPLARPESQEPDLLLVLGHLAMRRKSLDEGLAFYERARALRPQHAPTFLYLADVHQRRAEYGEAELALTQALALQPKFVDALILQGDVLRKRASHLVAAEARPVLLRARVAYEGALEVDGKNTWAKHQLGALVAELGDDETAERLLSDVRAAYPNDGELVLLLGHLASKRGAVQASYRAYVDATVLMPTDLRPWVFAGRAALALEHFNEAEAFFVEGLKADPTSAWANLERGYGQRVRRDWPGALISAQNATRLDPTNAEAWLFLGRLRQELKELEAALLAYEKASELAPLSALADRALASALTNRGKPGDLLRAELLLKRPLEQLGEVGFTHAIAGYTLVKLSKVLETNLPMPNGPETRENRKKRWSELGAFELSRAIELAPDDRNMRLAASVAFAELGRDDLARTTVAVLLEGGTKQCPADEWSWKWDGKPKQPELSPAASPEEVAVREDEKLRAEAHLLMGDIYEREDKLGAIESQSPGLRARLAYFCALQYLPSSAETHLRLAASYESVALLRLAEVHFLAAAQLDPTRSATQQLERLRKEGGYPLGPLRVSGVLSFVSEMIPGEVQSRQAQSLGLAAPALQQQLLTTPRNLAIGAEATWQREQWQSRLRLGLGYQFAWGFNTFLNDQLTFEDRQSHRAELFAAGRYGDFEDRRYELSWRAGYRFTYANALTRSEVRNQLYAQARLLRVDWGTADADVAYELGSYVPAPGAAIADTTGHSGLFGLRINPLLRRWQVELGLGYRAQIVGLLPSHRTIWLHELSADGRKTWVHWFIGGDLRGGISSDTQPVVPSSTVAAGSFMVRGHFGYAWSGYSRVMARSGVSLVPNQPVWNSVLIGAAGEHRFVFRGVGDADQGLAIGVSYDARVTYGLNRTEHLVSAVVTLGR